MATQADGLTSSVPDPLSEVLGCGLDSGDDRRQAQAYAVQAAKSAVQADADAKSAGNAARQPQRQTGPRRKQPAKPP